jgi:hypothetical protein
VQQFEGPEFEKTIESHPDRSLLYCRPNFWIYGVCGRVLVVRPGGVLEETSSWRDHPVSFRPSPSQKPLDIDAVPLRGRAVSKFELVPSHIGRYIYVRTSGAQNHELRRNET